VGTGLELSRSPYFPIEVALRENLVGTVEEVTRRIENLDPAAIAIADVHLAPADTLAVLGALGATLPVLVTVDTLHPAWATVDEWLRGLDAVRVPVDCVDDEGDVGGLATEDRIALEEAFQTLGDIQRAVVAAVALTKGRLDLAALPSAARDLEGRRILTTVDDAVVVRPRALESLALDAVSSNPGRRTLELIVEAGLDTADVVRALVALGREAEALELVTSALGAADAQERAALLFEAVKLDRTSVPAAVGALIDVGRFDAAASLEPEGEVLLRLEMSAGLHDEALVLARELDDEEAIDSLQVWPGWDASVAEGDACRDPMRALIRMDADWDARAKQVLESESPPLGRFNAAMVLAVGYALTGRGPAALEAIERALADIESVAELHSSAARAGAIAAYYVSGDLTVGSLDSPVDVVGTRGLLEAFTACAVADQGRTGDALGLLDATPLPAFGIGRSLLLWVRAEVELHAGRPHRVTEMTAVHGGRRDPATGLAVVAHAWASFEEAMPVPEPPPILYGGLAGISEEVNALRAASEKDFDTASDLLAKAARSWAQAHTRGELRCLWGRGEFLRRAGRQDEAMRLLEDVERRASELGIRPLVARSRQSLRRCGLALRSGGRGDGGSLSIREREVIELVGDGRTSHEIAQELGIARSTVETQIRSAMLKLGVGTRLEAAAKLREDSQ
jgi:DNA-binding CsgD family transcriptional regulator